MNNIDIESKLQILSDIAQGLEQLHSFNIAHMDLKLENVMKFGGRFKLIDLESSLDLNVIGSKDVNIKSTLSIMSPELYTFDKDKFSTNIDIWSYGMILYEIITREVIIQDIDQDLGYKSVKTFLKNKLN